MTASKGGSPRKRGTLKQHTTMRLEVQDRAWFEDQARLLNISPPDVVHGLVAAAKVPGSDAEKIAHLTGQVVFFENELARVARHAHAMQIAARDAHEKNFVLSQRLRAHIRAILALPAEIQRRMQEGLVSKSRRALNEAEVPEDQRVVVY